LRIGKAIIENYGTGALGNGYRTKIIIGDCYNEKITYSITLDNHFLLYEYSPKSGLDVQLFGVVDIDKKIEVDERLYNRAREFIWFIRKNEFIKMFEVEDKTRYKNKEIKKREGFKKNCKSY